MDQQELSIPAAGEAILARHIHRGDIVIIRYEGPDGGPDMREMAGWSATRLRPPPAALVRC